VRVHTGRCENEPWIGAGAISGDRCRRQRLANADYRDRARITGATDYLFAVAGERGVCEVRVAVDEAGRTPVLRGHLCSIQRRTGAAT
jgi:hypothetical protein